MLHYNSIVLQQGSRLQLTTVGSALLSVVYTVQQYHYCEHVPCSWVRDSGTTNRQTTERIILPLLPFCLATLLAHRLAPQMTCPIRCLRCSWEKPARQPPKSHSVRRRSNVLMKGRCQSSNLLEHLEGGPQEVEMTGAFPGACWSCGACSAKSSALRTQSNYMQLH